MTGGSDANKLRTAGYLREFDDSSSYVDSCQDVSTPGGQQRYFLLAEQVEGEDFLIVGFINQELVKENPLPFPTMVEGKEAYVHLMVDGRSAKDGAFVKPEYMIIKIVQHHDIPGLEEGPLSIRWYDGVFPQSILVDPSTTKRLVEAAVASFELRLQREPGN